MKFPSFFRFFSSLWAKLMIAAGVIALLVYFNRVDTSVLACLSEDWPWLLAAFALMLPTFLVVSCRFNLILRSQGIRAPSLQVVRWTMIGSFFDLAMPSASGGDLVKAGYVAGHVGSGKRTRAVMAVVFDRALGLLGLLVLVSLAGGFGWVMLSDLPARGMVAGISALVSLAALSSLPLLGSRRVIHSPVVDRALSRYAWGLHLRQFFTFCSSLRERPYHLFGALGLSILNHVFWCGSLFCIGKTIGESIDLIRGFMVFPLAIFSNIFGVAGGFGGGTLGFDLLFSQFLAIGNGALIGLMFQTLSALARLAGMPFYLFSSHSDLS